jgi:hypothetical protein
VLLSVKSGAEAPAGNMVDLLLRECGCSILFLLLMGIRRFVNDVHGFKVSSSISRNGVARFVTERGQGLRNRLNVSAAIGNG